MTAPEAVAALRALGNERNREGMARFGIATERAFGVSVSEIRRIAKQCGKSHTLAAELWATGFHEARILASVIDEPGKVKGRQMEEWIADFNSWDLCDQCCFNLFDKTAQAWTKVPLWARRTPVFQKRAGFALMAALAAHDRITPDSDFLPFFSIIEKQSDDDRNFVRKAVNWALRQIGKRNPALREEAIVCAHRILETGTRSGRWIARDALRELNRGYRTRH